MVVSDRGQLGFTENTVQFSQASLTQMSLLMNESLQGFVHSVPEEFENSAHCNREVLFWPDRTHKLIRDISSYSFMGFLRTSLEPEIRNTGHNLEVHKVQPNKYVSYKKNVINNFTIWFHLAISTQNIHYREPICLVLVLPSPIGKPTGMSQHTGSKPMDGLSHGKPRLHYT